ncbi:MAG: DcaP family trimeric outer membrane transporter [bacterium]
MKSIKIIAFLLNLLLFLLILANTSHAQEETAQDTTKTTITIDAPDTLAFDKEEMTGKYADISPLDIGSDRGLFILSADRLLELRILGSIRANFNYTSQDMPNNESFNPYEIPVDKSTYSFNYYAGVKQTRLGFEVIRRTRERGDIFFRLEADFLQLNGVFRLRHAYGQFGNFLFGKTWSLFNTIGYQPAMVSFDGSATGCGLRTPQLRYTHQINETLAWNVAIEYSQPTFIQPDTIAGELLQVIPDFTGRFSYTREKISFRIAIIGNVITGRRSNGEIEYLPIYGGSFAARVSLWKAATGYMSISGGKGISRFIDMFSGKSGDIIYNPGTDKFEALGMLTTYLAIGQNLPEDLSLSAGFGYAVLENKPFQLDTDFNIAFDLMLNLFWNPVAGARFGIEYAFGRRYDKDDDHGNATRLSALIIYDF